jgi:malate synthase
VLPPEKSDRVLDGFLEMLADKEREAVDGHDGTIVGYPGLVEDAMAEFAKSMPGAHQIGFQRHDPFTAMDLVQRPEGTISVESLVGMLRTTIRSFAYRRLGRPSVVQGGRLHDRSSVQLALALLWQWNHSPQGIISANGLAIHKDLMQYLVRKETTKLFLEATNALRESGEQAAEQVLALVLGEAYPAVPEC